MRDFELFLGVVAIALVAFIFALVAGGNKESYRDRYNSLNKSYLERGCEQIDFKESYVTTEPRMVMGANGLIMSTTHTVSHPSMYKYKCADGEEFWIERDITKNI